MESDDDQYRIARAMLSIGHSTVPGLKNLEEEKIEENHQRDEREKKLQAEIKFNNKLLHSIQKDNRFQNDNLVEQEFTSETLKEFYSKKPENSEKEQDLNAEVLDDSESRKSFNNNQQVKFKDQKMFGKKIEIELSVEVPNEPQCTSTSTHKRKQESPSSVKEMEIQLYLDIQQENELNLNEEESDEMFNSTFMKFINQQLEELENKLKMNNATENKQLRYKLEKIQRLGISKKFAENVIFNSSEKTKSFYERLNKCNQYFQQLNNKTSKNIKVEEHKCNEETSNQYDPETSQQIVNEVANKIQLVDEKKKCINRESSEEIEQLEFKELELESQVNMKRSLEKREGFDMDIEENQDEMDECSDMDVKVCDSEIDEDSIVDIEKNHDKMEVKSLVIMEENQKEVKEDSDVDIEGYDTVQDEDLTVDIEGNFEVDIEENQNEMEEEHNVADIIGFHETNEVEEIIEDYLEECSSPIESSNLKNEKPLSSLNSLTPQETDSPFCWLFNKTMETSFDFNLEENSIYEKLANIDHNNIEDFEVKLDDLEGNLSTQKLKQLMDLIKDNPELCDTFPNFLNEFNELANQKYFEDQKIENDIESTIPELTDVLENQNRTFAQIKEELLDLKRRDEEFLQQKAYEEQMQESDTDNLLAITSFPDDLEEMLNSGIDESNLEELQRECNDLESEFNHKIPFEDHDFTKLSPSEFETKKCKQQKPYNLFEKLYAIHKKKVSEFINSNEWPYPHLCPSGLLDTLFEDPSEIKPHVLVLTLYSIDIGYSIKITKKPNEPPEETFYSYAEDNNSILSYIEEEKIPPQLLEELNKANPRIFYSACVIVEIYDQVYGPPGELYRILLRPSNMSIKKYMSLIMAENNRIHWTNKKKLKLESKLLISSYPTMCMDILPDTGMAINLQHQQLSYRSLELNPLKKKLMYPKYHTMDTGLFKNPNDNLLNYNKNESSSKIMDAVNQKIVLLMQFEIHINNMKVFVLSGLICTETHEYSMLVSSNSNMEYVGRIRFRINYESHDFKSYFTMFFNIVEQQTNFDVKLHPTYVFGHEKVLRLIKNVPKLLNDSVYEPNDMDQIFKIFSFDVRNFLMPLKKFKNVTFNENDLKDNELNMTVQTSINLQKSDKTKQLEDKFKESTHLYTTAKLSNDSTKFLELSKTNLDKVEEIMNSAPMGRPKKSCSIPVHKSTILLGRDSTTQTNSSSNTMLLNESRRPSNVVRKEFDSMSSTLNPLTTTTQLSESSPLINIPSPSSKDITLGSATTNSMSSFETEDLQNINDTYKSLSQNIEVTLTEQNGHYVYSGLDTVFKTLDISDSEIDVLDKDFENNPNHDLIPQELLTTPDDLQDNLLDNTEHENPILYNINGQLLEIKFVPSDGIVETIAIDNADEDSPNNDQIPQELLITPDDLQDNLLDNTEHENPILYDTNGQLLEITFVPSDGIVESIAIDNADEDSPNNDQTPQEVPVTPGDSEINVLNNTEQQKEHILNDRNEQVETTFVPSDGIVETSAMNVADEDSC